MRYEVVVLQRDSLELDRDVDKRVAPGHLEDLGRHLFQNLRARIVVLVDAMPKSHQAPLTLLDLPDHRGNRRH